MNPVSALVVDTSCWIEFFAGRSLPPLELALKEGRVILSPIVVAELLSGAMSPAKEQQLVDFLGDLEIHLTPTTHWLAVGRLRRQCQKAGFLLSTPDAHVAQCALDRGAFLYSFDKIFKRIASKVSLKTIED